MLMTGMHITSSRLLWGRRLIDRAMWYLTEVQADVLILKHEERKHPQKGTWELNPHASITPSQVSARFLPNPLASWQ